MNEFIDFLRKNISDKDICSLSLVGFNEPNDFSILHLQKIIKAGKYPEDNLKEYCFGIYETPFEEIEAFQPYLRVYIYTIFLYSYFKENGCIDALDEIYLYLFLKTISKLQIDKRLIELFLKELENETKAPIHFLELARLIVSCNNIECKEFRGDFLTSFKNDGSTIYDDFHTRWISIIPLCTNHELKGCIEDTLNKALKVHNQYKEGSFYRFHLDLFSV